MKLHLIGICGTGMGSLAGLLKSAGHDVRGSDEHVYPPMSTQLQAQGIAIFDGFRAENLDWKPDQVVVGNVCRRDHIEVVEAQRLGLKLTSFPAVLEELFLVDRVPLVVAGTHGKTTTSAVAAAVLLAAGKDPGFLIGGVPLGIAHGYRSGSSGSPFVVEGDEYDTAFFDKGSKFFHYRPHVAILTSVELDHIDIFDSLEAVKAAFKQFVKLIPENGLLVVQADDAGAVECAAVARCPVERYRVETHRPSEVPRPVPGAHWTATVSGTRTGRTRFRVERSARGDGTDRVPFGEFETGLAGLHNLNNALAVIAAAAAYGISAEAISRGLRRFVGVRRRQEVRGVAQGVTVIDDFAHHPTAVRATLQALRGRHGAGRLFAVYEPRSATSRRAIFQKEYVEAFSHVDEVIIGAVHAPEKTPDDDRFDPERLAADLRGRGIAARFIAGADAIAAHVAARAAPGDTVVVMSSGGFGGVHDKILDRLGMAVTEARASDVPAIKALLDRASLSYPDLEAHLDDLLVLRDAGQVVGCVALERYEDDALLRSLAVVAERRGEGLGWLLAEAALSRARQQGALRTYLLTETATTEFFAEKFGFTACERTHLAPALLSSSQFRTARSSQALTMKLDL